MGARAAIVGAVLGAGVLAACAPGGGLRAPALVVGTVAATTTVAPTTVTPTSSVAPTTVAPTTTTTFTPRQVTIAVSGDVLLHRPVVTQGAVNGRASGVDHDFAPMFRLVQPLLSGVDLAICHLETPVAPPGEPYSGYPRFAVPAGIAAGLATAGFDRCSTASNHSWDRRGPGVDATLDALDAAGLGHAGTARRPEEALPQVIDVAGVRVAHLAATYGLNGLRLPPDEPWRVRLIDVDALIADATAARAAGAELVVVSLHWGAEYVSAPTAEQRRVAEALTASGAVDLIVGHHAHVLQPIEQVNGRWVVFGLGNFLSNQHGSRCCPPASQDGAIVVLTAAEQPGGGFVVATPVVVPTMVDRRTFTITPVREALADPSTPPGLRTQLLASLARTEAVLGPYIVTG